MRAYAVTRTRAAGAVLAAGAGTSHPRSASERQRIVGRHPFSRGCVSLARAHVYPHEELARFADEMMRYYQALAFGRNLSCFSKRRAPRSTRHHPRRRSGGQEVAPVCRVVQHTHRQRGRQRGPSALQEPHRPREDAEGGARRDVLCTGTPCVCSQLANAELIDHIKIWRVPIAAASGASSTDLSRERVDQLVVHGLERLVCLGTRSWNGSTETNQMVSLLLK